MGLGLGAFEGGMGGALQHQNNNFSMTTNNNNFKMPPRSLPPPPSLLRRRTRGEEGLDSSIFAFLKAFLFSSFPFGGDVGEYNKIK